MKKLALGAGIGLVALVAAAQIPIPRERERRPEVQGPVSFVPNEYSAYRMQREEPRKELNLEVFGSNNIAEYVKYGLTPRGQVFASDFIPIEYDIPGVMAGVSPFYFEQGATGGEIKLGKPQDLSGKKFILYGMHPRTRERVILYERHFSTVPMRATSERKKR